MDPLRETVGGTFPDWILPQTLSVDGTDIQIADIPNVFDVDWPVVARYKSAVLESLQVQKWEVMFYTEEPDPTPPRWPDRPRLDILITFTDESWVRWHPSGDLIWSTETMPTTAMRIRMNRKQKLFKTLAKKQCS